MYSASASSLSSAGQQAIGHQRLQCGFARAGCVAEHAQQRQRQAGGQRQVELGGKVPPAKVAPSALAAVARVG
jgi:hypothetical protein